MQCVYLVTGDLMLIAVDQKDRALKRMEPAVLPHLSIAHMNHELCNIRITSFLLY